jgi:hypothetical protein
MSCNNGEEAYRVRHVDITLWKLPPIAVITEYWNKYPETLGALAYHSGDFSSP